MAWNDDLKAAIEAVIFDNDDQLITGEALQEILKTMVDEIAAVVMGGEIDGDLHVTGNTILDGGLTVENGVDINASLEADFLHVNGSAEVGQDLSVTQDLFVEGNTLLEGRFEMKMGASVAAANNLTLGVANLFHITGATQINAITTADWKAGSEIILIFDSTPTVKNNTAGGVGTSKILLAGGVDFVASANDVLKLIYDAVSWFEVSRSVN